MKIDLCRGRAKPRPGGGLPLGWSLKCGARITKRSTLKAVRPDAFHQAALRAVNCMHDVLDEVHREHVRQARAARRGLL